MWLHGVKHRGWTVRSKGLEQLRIVSLVRRYGSRYVETAATMGISRGEWTHIRKHGVVS